MTVLPDDFAGSLQHPGPRSLRDLALALCSWSEEGQWSDLQRLGIEASVALRTHKVSWHRLTNQGVEVKAYLVPYEGNRVGQWYMNPATNLNVGLRLAVDRAGPTTTVHLMARDGSYRANVRTVPLIVASVRAENAVLALALMLEWRKVDERAFAAFLDPLGDKRGQVLGDRLRPGLVSDVRRELGTAELHGGGSSSPPSDGSRSEGGASPIGDMDPPAPHDGDKPA